MYTAGETKIRRRRKKNNKGGENGGIKKRKLSDEQVNLLEENFGNEHKLESERKDKLAMELGLDPRQVAVWFQNRRARWKNKKLEEEYSNLKKVHESTILEKCRLETEVGIENQSLLFLFFPFKYITVLLYPIFSVTRIHFIGSYVFLCFEIFLRGDTKPYQNQ